MFWTSSGPGVRDVPDSWPPTATVSTVTERRSLRGERFKKVEDAVYHRRLFAAKADEVDPAWADFPGAKMVTEQDPETGAVTGVFLLMVVYVGWDA